MNASPAPAAASVTPTPTKHVNYTLGMVLGVDDLIQEFTFLNGRQEAHARDAIGYGTVTGLQLTVETDARGPRVMVSPGVALGPRGDVIRVCAAQCAYVADWMRDHRREIADRLASPPAGAISAFVTLCYRDCPTDPVPIPGEPCRSEEDLSAFSRLADDFRLELRFDPPGQGEEDALRAFVEWLSQGPVGGARPGSTVGELLDAIRAAALIVSSPPGAPMFGDSVPMPSLRIAADDACEFVRAAFRLWVTELRTESRM